MVSTCPASTVVVIVTDNNLAGTGVDTKGAHWGIRGTVAADGVVSGMHGDSPLSGKIENGVLRATFPSVVPRCGERTLTLTRDAQR